MSSRKISLSKKSGRFVPEQVESRRCGTCVFRNALKDQGKGYCPYQDCMKRHDQPACKNWFGMLQLRSPRYGR